MLKELIDLSKPVLVEVAKLKNHPRNPRKQKPEAMEFLKKSVDRLGSFRPLIVNNNNEVLAGNQLLTILKDKKVEQCYCVYPKGELTEDQEKEIIVADNSNSFHKSSNTFDIEIFANEFDDFLDKYDIAMDDIDLNLSIDEPDEPELVNGEENDRASLFIECDKDDSLELYNFLQLKLKEASFENVVIDFE